MSYRALYRVWRPQSFKELVGQQVIATTLQNAVQHRQLSHAYLFTGPRGTGKTSVAKILAKAVNCERQTDGNPCNECEMCQAITQGQLSDVIEIDAASHNGVDEIRDLRDKVRYAPTQATYKVYIIDEVHMLTTGAFNALLKTLEEPPPQVIFILATTEPHKIPATIISRTQRFDFQKIQVNDLVERMAYILEKEQTTFDREGLQMIARVANGGLRDSLSLLDQALSYNAQHVSLETALQVTGSLAQQVYVQYIHALYQQQGQRAFDLVTQALQEGKQATRFIEELMGFSRDILLTQHTKRNYTLLQDDELAVLQDVPSEYYYRLVDKLQHVQQQMRLSTQADLYLEVATLELASMTQEVSSSTVQGVLPTAEFQALQQQVAQLSQQVQQLEQQLQQRSQVSEHTNRPSTDVPRTPRTRPAHLKVEYTLDVDSLYYVLNQATREDLQQVKQQWAIVLGHLSPLQRGKLGNAQVLAASPTGTVVSIDNDQMCGLAQRDEELAQQLATSILSVTGQRRHCVFITQSDWSKYRQQYAILRKQSGGKSVEVTLLPNSPLMNQVTQEVAVPKVQQEKVQQEEVPLPEEPPHMNEQDVPMAEDTVQSVPEVVQKAIDLFGADSVTVHYDQ